MYWWSASCHSNYIEVGEDILLYHHVLFSGYEQSVYHAIKYIEETVKKHNYESSLDWLKDLSM